MKAKFLIFYIIIFIYRCSGQNTTDPQVSKNIHESKKNGFFIKTYAFAGSTDKDIIVEAAWLENIWFNKISNVGKIIKVKWLGCQLCFKLQQNSQLKYKLSNILDWNIRFVDAQKFPANPNVGMTYGTYTLDFKTLSVPDTIILDLFERKDINSEIIKTKVGTLIFKAVENKKGNGK